MRVLLSEGSGLTSRQVATRLGQLGHHVEILSSTPICLTRFTRHVRKVHRVPAFASQPLAWLEAAAQIAKERAIDVLFPTQEQVAVLSARRASLRVATIAPAFESLRRVQDKISAFRTLEAAGVSQPESLVLGRLEELERVERFPVFVKRPISTASAGVRRASSPAELRAAATTLGLGAGQVLVQQQASGPLAMVQAIADDGRLVACHANLRVREGVGGGASIKESVALPGLPDHVARLARALRWHGPLSLDVIVTRDGPLAIDVNPRIVEPMNAYLAGVDLVAAALDLAQGRRPAEQPAGRAGVRTHQTLLAVLGAAQRYESRRAVARELFDALAERGDYAGSVEELTPIAGDPFAAIPVVAAVAATMARPSLWRVFQSGAVGPYALTPEAWERIVAAADDPPSGS
jgi:glutathione synthase/RimK-type ligase-like ATP-grasp enzyme